MYTCYISTQGIGLVVRNTFATAACSSIKAGGVSVQGKIW